VTATAGGTTALDGVVWASGALAVGSAILAVGHMGVEIPLVSALGPGGARPVWPAAIAFTVAAGLHGAVSWGVARRRSWAWPLGVLVGAITLVGAATPFRGAGCIGRRPERTGRHRPQGRGDRSRSRERHCTVADRTRAHHTRGLCRAHHQRLLATGSVQADVPIREVTGDGSATRSGQVRARAAPALRPGTRTGPLRGVIP
jgi:hypothetical protein